MGQNVLTAALEYHREGLCVIPVKERGKAPALVEWKEYQCRRSTTEEIMQWFGNGNHYNIGAVHGEVSGNYVLLDIDDDAGIYAALRAEFPVLVAGRVIQSGSGEGYHVPLMLDRLPDFGHDSKHDRPRGNRTWKTKQGNVNIRCRWCQSVLPPSVHPSGCPYRFLQEGPITHTAGLATLIAWLDKLAPPPPPTPLPSRKRSAGDTGGTLIEAVKAAWPTVFLVLEHFGVTGQHQREPDGETRICGHGGLLVTDDDQTWYNFSDEVGGGIIEAWGWCRFGSAYDKQRHFRQVLLEMAQAAGIDAAQHYRRGDEKVTTPAGGDRQRWSKEYQGAWGRMR